MLVAAVFQSFASEADAAREPAIRRETRELEPHLATERQCLSNISPALFATMCVFEGGSALPHLITRPAVCRRFEAGSDRAEAQIRLGIN